MFRIYLAALLLTASSWIAGATAASTSVVGDEADLILRNGDIYAADGWHKAFAVKNGVIIAVGDDSSIRRYQIDKTQVIDLEGATVVPGLHDMHVHPLGAGRSQMQCRFPQGSMPQVVLSKVAECIKSRPEGAWIVGGQWDVASFGATPPNRALLDSVSPDNPVLLADISGHSAWVNSKALELSGINAKTPDPKGGIIERDARGEPTGLLREAASWVIYGHIPPSTDEENAAALKWSLDQMLSYGVTSFTDAGVDGSTLRAYATLSDEGLLKQRVRGCVMWRPVVFSASVGAPIDAIQNRNLYARERFKPDCIKIVLDGVPTDGHTAAMVEPYADAAHTDPSRARGLLQVPQGVLNAAVTDFDARGLTVKFHAAGDAAVRAGLNAIEAARKANGFTGLLHDVGHNSFVQMSDIKRARNIHATFEMSPYIWYPNPIIPDIAKAIGPERMKRWIPVKDAIDSGALVVPGSDWNVVPSVNPWIAIETLVTRLEPGGGGEPLGEAEKISLKQAMDMFTVNSARQMGQSNQLGAIEPGMLADVLVIDRNPFKIPVTDIHNTKVLMTIINGEIVYRSTSTD